MATRHTMIWRGAAAAALLAGALTGAGAGAATAVAAVAAVPAGTIAALAGGVGGPGPATSVSVAPCGTQNSRTPCGMTFAGGQLYLTDIGYNAPGEPSQAGDVVRAVSLATGRLTTPAGN
ncbi:MAG TPA: hypothetical protein VHV49_00690, partial [Pseudonocardiaceae bacterium]|nr:hypothetical protein [Pseudonocardiaceae bacterium]